MPIEAIVGPVLALLVSMKFIDYKSKEAGVGKILYPSGDIEKDMSVIEEFYQGVTPKFSEYYNPKIY